MKPKCETWDFDKWFAAQYGPAPSPEVSLAELERRASDLHRQAVSATHEVMALKNWIAARTAALYAWQISDTAKRGKKDKKQ